MCIAILTTGNSKVPEENLRTGWRANPDGGGIAYIKDGRVVVNKGIMNVEEFIKSYEDAHIQSDAGSSMLLHFRIGTSGLKSQNNTHPFAIKPQKGPHGAMIHNGVMFKPAGAWTGPADDAFSDTRVFCNANNNILALEAVQNNKAALLTAIGNHNKLVFLYDDNTHVIVNEQAGFWHDGMWFSNRTCGIGSYANARR